MALEIKSKVTINPAGTELYIEFRQETGDYHVDDNPGGFGVPNPERNALAVFLYAVHKLVAGDSPADIQANNPISVESFTLNLTRGVNGVLYYVVIAIPIFDDEAEYDDGDIVWDNITDPVNPTIYKMVEGDWEALTLEDLVNGDEDSLDQKEGYAFPIPNAIEWANTVNAEKLLAYKKLKNGKCASEEYTDLKDKFLYVDGTIKAATTAFCNQAYNQAQIKIEEVFAYEDSFSDE